MRLTHGLLAHSALVRVPGRLVVVGVGNEARTHSQQSEGLDLQVGRVSTDGNSKENTETDKKTQVGNSSQ